MDAREARTYVMSNPPTDPVLAERRPSLLGRLFRRSSSLSESDANPVPAAIPVMKPQQNQPNGQPEMVRRVSITEAVQAQFGTSPPAQQQIRPNPVIDHEFGIYT